VPDRVAHNATPHRRRSLIAVWVLRIAWIAVGSAVSFVVDDTGATRWVLAVTWTIAAVAISVPAVITLTVARITVPLAPIAVAITAIDNAAREPLALGVAAVAASAATVIVLSAEVGAAFVQASAYGAETRLLLRPPAAFGAAAVVMWVVWSALSSVAAVALAHAMVVTTTVTGVPAIAAAVFAAPRWHRLARRWLVGVPAGIVVHDPLVLNETLMMRHRDLTGVVLASADTGAADLTGPAGGTAIEITVRESTTVLIADGRNNPRGRAIHARAVLVAPTRPGWALSALSRTQPTAPMP